MYFPENFKRGQITRIENKKSKEFKDIVIKYQSF